jgi:hypothetical protein
VKCFCLDVVVQVNLQTTGGKSVRFNPNLYKDGKVCLSLLGTWDGHKSETWDSQVSTINQVRSVSHYTFLPQTVVFVSQQPLPTTDQRGGRTGCCRVTGAGIHSVAYFRARAVFQ